MYTLIPENQLIPQKGRLLLAEPYIDDPFFKKSVIYLCGHSEEGSFGFVLNNYIDFDFDRVGQEFPSLNTKVSIGGPVQNSNLFFLHTLAHEVRQSMELGQGIFMGGDFDHLQQLVREDKVAKTDVRFFVGYSGWSPNQLEEEIKSNSWIVAPCYLDLLMNTSIDDLWTAVLKKMGKNYARLAELPKDPSLN